MNILEMYDKAGMVLITENYMSKGDTRPLTDHDRRIIIVRNALREGCTVSEAIQGLPELPYGEPVPNKRTRRTKKQVLADKVNELNKQGLSRRAIAKELGISKDAVQRILA